MSNESKHDLIIKKRIEKRKQEMFEKAEKELNQTMTNTIYGTMTNPDKGGRNYLLYKINFDIKSMKAIIEDYIILEQKVIGVQFPIEQQNLKYYYDKSTKVGKKNENK